MRRFFSTSFIALALVTGAAPSAHAQAALLDTSDTASCPAGQVEGLGAQAEQCFDASGNVTSASPSISGANQPVDFSKDTASQFGTIMTWLMSLFAWLVGVAAITLDNAVFYTVVTMGDYVNNLSAVGVTWQILRDLGNIIIIFGFLAIGITTILNVNWYGGGAKMLPMLLVSAIFLNFSLFLSQAVIDTGNLFATQFYTQINGGNPAGVKSFDPGISIRLQNEGISSKLMSQLGLQTIYGEAARNKEVFKAGNTWIIGFMAIILFIITAFVMFSLAFILIARFVILLFLIIISPIGFAGLAIPQLKNMANKWWGTLFEQAITAPVLLLLLYIALAVITDERFLTGLCISTDPANKTCTANAVGWVSGNFQGFASYILSFLVAMGLLLAVTIFSKKLSAFGGSWATKTAGKLTFGATAFGLRSTAGKGLNAAARRFRSSKLSRVPIIGRTFAGALDRGAKASFDVRGATTLGGLKGIGVDAGEAQKGGYRKIEEEAIKGREEHAKSLQLSRSESVVAKTAEEAAEAAKDAYEKDKTPATKLAMKVTQKAASDARGAAQLKYAKGLELYSKEDSFINKWVNPHRNTKAAENIRKTVEKSKDQQQIDALMNTIKGSTGGGTGAPPSPPPAGGGAKPIP